MTTARQSNHIGWMAHPLAGDIPGNIARAKRWMKWLIRTFYGVDFAADWVLWCEILDDNDHVERSRGIRFDNAMIRILDSFWMVGGRISNGMNEERKAAEESGKPIIDLTALGDEPPQETGYKLLSKAEQVIITEALKKAGIYDQEIDNIM